ncbi:MAG: hypothetical protein COA42_23610, partial [Alteromonadaceae bacterium]
MSSPFTGLLSTLLNSLLSSDHPASIFSLSDQPDVTSDAAIAWALNSAFLKALSGDDSAVAVLRNYQSDDNWCDVSAFYLASLNSVPVEFERLYDSDAEFCGQVDALIADLSSGEHKSQAQWREAIWSVFFPDACGLIENPEKAQDALRASRLLEITPSTGKGSITNAGKQLLFSSNVLLSIPLPGADLSAQGFDEDFITELNKIAQEPQLYWYDHPIPIGVSAEQNELLYGLKGFDSALAHEVERGNLQGKVRVALSVSVTHKGLQAIARSYIEDLFLRYAQLQHIELYIFTEEDTQAIIEQVLAPLAKATLNVDDAAPALQVFGVDGEYGRHYSFLKAVLPLFTYCIDSDIKATFKIDLDQTFQQAELIAETGKSVLEHFNTPLWGADATRADGKPVHLGMIAGGLVDQFEIDQGLFTPDVKMPSQPPRMDEQVFFSVLPQAVSTVAEMMTQYQKGSDIDGETKALQRIHVTGGTNGILLDSLMRYRPFTPSFIGRAEDQAYILSTLDSDDLPLAYCHAAGLIMRHDKQAFAADAIEHAVIGKLISDYIRILHFSDYVEALETSTAEVKQLLAPYTGCFVSKLPNTLVTLRFALKTADFLAQGQTKYGLDFIREGSLRIAQAQEELLGGWLEQQYL